MTEHISEDELRREYARLDALIAEDNKAMLTEEQFALIRYAREGTKRLSWPAIRRYWIERGWGNVPMSTIKNRYYAMRATRSMDAMP